MSSYCGIVFVGLGTHLRSEFLSGPKSMAPVADRPFLEHVLAKLPSRGIKDVVLCVGYSRSHIRSHFHKGTKWGLDLRYCVEEEPLGNAGAVKRAASMIHGDAPFVFNGNALLELDLKAMWDFHHGRKALATVALVTLPRANGCGHILTNERGEITAFGGAHDEAGDRADGKYLVNAGTYLLSRQFIDLIPEGRSVSIEQEMFQTIIGAGLYGFCTDGYFVDIGFPGDLARAQSELPLKSGI